MKKQIITTFVIIVISSLLIGQNSRMGSASSTQLLVVPSAKHLSGGGAAATATGMDAAFWNPAGLANSENNIDAIFSNRQYIADITNSFFGVATAIGAFAGILSAWGFMKLGPYLLDKIGLHDTCGVHNLHGMPGICGGVFGAIFTGLAGSNFNDIESINATFPGVNLKLDADGKTMILDCEGKAECWDLSTQAGWQMGALCITLVISILSGALTGFIATRVCS